MRIAEAVATVDGAEAFAAVDPPTRGLQPRLQRPKSGGQSDFRIHVEAFQSVDFPRVFGDVVLGEADEAVDEVVVGVDEALEVGVVETHLRSERHFAFQRREVRKVTIVFEELLDVPRMQDEQTTT